MTDYISLIIIVAIVLYYLLTYKRRFIKYIANGGSYSEKCESPIEIRMYKALLAEGLNPIPQHWIGQIQTRLCFIQNGKKIAIECDGKKHHSSSSNEHVITDAMNIENRGWIVMRFTDEKGGRFVSQSVW